MYRHVYGGTCSFRHPVINVRTPRVTKLSVANIAVIILGQLRTIKHAKVFI